LENPHGYLQRAVLNQNAAGTGDGQEATKSTQRGVDNNLTRKLSAADPVMKLHPDE
jgi:hypothetical protein